MKGVKAWAKAALVRAVRTAVQTAVASVPANILGTDWKVLGSVVAGAFVTSLLMSLKGLPEISGEEPAEEPAEAPKQ